MLSAASSLRFSISTCGVSPASAQEDAADTQESLQLKLFAIAAILVLGACGVWMPLAGKKRHRRAGEGNTSLAFGATKSFAAGVVLATGFVHMLHGSEHALSNACLPEFPWRMFPFPGFIAMTAALLTLVLDCAGAQFFESKHGNDPASHGLLLETSSTTSQNHEHRHGQGHGHGHRRHGELSAEVQSIVVSQILELGIISHSVIIGLSLGTSRSAPTIRPLVAALSFHQFFEGFALGECISQANFSGKKTLIMAAFFAITTPSGIGVGAAVSSFYNPNSPGALVVEGVLDAVSAGILIYMALVDLIAPDFLSGKLASRPRLQFVSFVSLFVGGLSMSLLAIWA